LEVTTETGEVVLIAEAVVKTKRVKEDA